MKKTMRTPGTPAGTKSTRRSPLAPTGTGPSGLTEDFSVREVQKGRLRPKQGGVGGSDAALGMKSVPVRKATTAGAQYRVSSALPAPVAPEARATQANGRIVPAIMGSKQRRNFDVQRGVLY